MYFNFKPQEAKVGANQFDRDLLKHLVSLESEYRDVFVGRPTLFTTHFSFSISGPGLNLADVQQSLVDNVALGPNTKTFKNQLGIHVGKKQVKIWNNAHISITGCRGESEIGPLQQAEIIVRAVKSVLQWEGYCRSSVIEGVDVLMMNFRWCFKSRIDLSRMYDLLAPNLTEGEVVYDPENYAGLMLKPNGERVTISIFTSGKFLFLGMRDKEDLPRFAEFLGIFLKDPDFVREISLA